MDEMNGAPGIYPFATLPAGTVIKSLFAAGDILCVAVEDGPPLFFGPGGQPIDLEPAEADRLMTVPRWFTRD